MQRATYNIRIHGYKCTSIFDLALAIYLTKGPVIFNAGYRGGVKQGGGTKIVCNIFMGYENFLPHFDGVRKYF